MIIGADEALENIKQQLQLRCPWITNTYGRAYLHREKIGKKTHEIPKVWSGMQNEYIDVRPNDFSGTMSFFYVTSDEEVTNNKVNFIASDVPDFETEVALIVWVNTSLLANHTSGPSLTLQKNDVLNVLKSMDLVTGIHSIMDQDAQQIYKEFTISDDNTQYTMLPFGGFRFNFSIRHNYSSC